MILIASCKELPEPDNDEKPLVLALAKAGISTAIAAWDDPNVRWECADLVLVRSTWNYHQHIDEFLEWIARVTQRSRLLNPAAVIRWNYHKSYLVELEKKGIAVAPTELLRSGDEGCLESLMRKRGWDEVVIKPAVSGGSYRTLRSRAQVEGQNHLATLLKDTDVLVQSYLASVEERGERSMIFVDGELTHAVRKSPRFQGDEEETIPVVPEPHEVEFSKAVLDACPYDVEDLVYARVDVAPDNRDQLVLMELELIEPSLFLTWGAHNTASSAYGLDRLVNRLARELAKA